MPTVAPPIWKNCRQSVYEKANVGLAFDGDADRLLAVDENGNIVDGDQIMAIVGNYMKSKGTLKKDTIVATVMSNLGFFLMAEKNAIHMEKTKVGDRYVLERMKEIGASSAANSPVTLFSWMRIPPETDTQCTASAAGHGGYRKASVRTG